MKTGRRRLSAILALIIAAGAMPGCGGQNHGQVEHGQRDLTFGSYPGGGSAAWTYDGKPVPYSSAFNSDMPTVDPAAEIAVQQIHGPLLLDCGTDDQIWTSCAYAQAIQSRLTAARDHYPHVLYRYSGAGHFVGQLIPYEPALFFGPTNGYVGDIPLWSVQGGTPLANVNADARLWPRVLSFLSNPAGQTGTFTAPATPPPLTTT